MNNRMKREQRAGERGKMSKPERKEEENKRERGRGKLSGQR